MDSKIMGIIQIVGACIAVILAFVDLAFWSIVLFGILFVIVGVHHIAEAHT